MRALIKNGTVVTASDTFAADVWIEDGRISAISATGMVLGQADKTIDARGKYVIPGGIDCHTHLDMPFGGTSSSDDFESGTIAAWPSDFANHASRPARIEPPFAWIAKSTIVVVPPCAAATVPV